MQMPCISENASATPYREAGGKTGRDLCDLPERLRRLSQRETFYRTALIRFFPVKGKLAAR